MIIRSVVSALQVPEESVLADARRHAGDPARHEALAARVAALGEIEHRSGRTRTASGRFRVAAWNAERLKFAGASERLVMFADADIVLMSEIDLGMARSGNRHTLRELGDALELDRLFCVEFVELGHGDARETAAHGHERNLEGFHGNGILSRFPLKAPFVVKLDDGGVWFDHPEQGRLGARNAIAARIDAPTESFWAVSVHLESKTDPQDRCRQTLRLLEALRSEIGHAPCVIGGDFNTKAMPSDETDLAAAFSEPERHEPLFAVLRAAGFEWRTANRPQVTQRMRPDGAPLPPHRRLDWIFVRGLEAFHAETVPAVDEEGRAISDHDMITADVDFRRP